MSFSAGAVGLARMVPQDKSFFAVRKITDTKKNMFLLVRRLAASPRPASFGLVATLGAGLQNVAATTDIH